jgi:hypothetical protein
VSTPPAPRGAAAAIAPDRALSAVSGAAGAAEVAGAAAAGGAAVAAVAVETADLDVEFDDAHAVPATTRRKSKRPGRRSPAAHASWNCFMRSS